MHKKSPKTPIFIGSKKGGQVIDPKVAKLLTLLWPKNGQVIDPTAYIYISFYAHALLKKMLKSAEKVHFLAKQRTNFGCAFLADFDTKQQNVITSPVWGRTSEENA